MFIKFKTVEGMFVVINSDFIRSIEPCVNPRKEGKDFFIHTEGGTGYGVSMETHFKICKVLDIKNC